MQINNRAIVTGVTGQDGYYLSKFLLEKGYTVIGMARRKTGAQNQIQNLNFYNHYYPRYQEVQGDICDTSFMYNLIQEHTPDHFYNLAAQSHVGYSFSNPDITFDVNANAVLGILESIRLTSPHTKFYQASTSEMFGTVEGRANERTQLNPASPYGVAKTAAHHMVKVYRESYGLFACSGILFNHESSRRGKDFVTRKITSFVADYKHFVPTPDTKLKLGNIESVRDWGWAPDFVMGMCMMLSNQEPEDYVLATGKTKSIRNLLDVAFDHIGINNWTRIVEHNTPADLRPNDVTRLCGNADKAQYELGWEPTIGFEQMIKDMIDAETPQ
tara:strand:- start:370 stop:1356 length:987 start_codon:yes stop_codon:yes gene_type:complete